jgi:hypothetical protein
MYVEHPHGGVIATADPVLAAEPREAFREGNRTGGFRSMDLVTVKPLAKVFFNPIAPLTFTL